jgi:hypothetical protein
MDTAAVLGNAMADYLLAVSAKRAPAARAPEHMAEWLDAHGYRIVRLPAGIEAALRGQPRADVRRVA